MNDELRKEFETLLTEACLAHYKAGENYAISSDVDYGKLCDIAKAKQRLVVAAALKRYEEIAESQQVMALMLAHKDAEIAQLKQAHADLFATSQEMNADLVALRKELEAVKKDAERLNHLESEKNSDSTKSLFRQNMPITREAIDAAMQSGK